jgi:hypothetical protein
MERLIGWVERLPVPAGNRVHHLARVPTWPWPPSTLRGFVIALVIPILIWLVQFGLQRSLAP